MRIARAVLLLGLLAPLAARAAETPAPSVSQNPAAPGDEQTRILDVARRVMTSARHCALVTIGASGRAESRIVDPFPPEPDLTVWIATRAGTRKLAEIAADPRVTLFYWDRSSSAYVTIQGDARIVVDPAEKAKRWKPEWHAFYADENRGADYVLIRVTPRHLEALADDLPNDPATWRPRQLDLP